MSKLDYLGSIGVFGEKKEPEGSGWIWILIIGLLIVGKVFG